MKSAIFVEFITIFVKINIYKYFLIKFITRRLITMKNEKLLSTKIKDGVKNELMQQHIQKLH